MLQSINHPCRRAAVLLALLILCSGLLGCGGVHVTEYYEKGAVATGAPLATAAAIDVFSKGGNAFDAAVAVGFTLAVVHPEAGNIGGGGFAVIRDGASGAVSALDFRETAPGAATTTMYLDDDGNVIADLSTYGARAAGVPGTVAGLHELWERGGSLPWADLVRVAADLADSGFVVDDYLAESLAKYGGALSGFESTANQFLPGGRAPGAGDRLVQKDLAATLYAVASEGPSGFYEGQTAERIAACMTANGGLITTADLLAYRPVWREPVHFTFDSLDIYSMSPPSSGGVVIGQILKLLEPFDLSRYGPTSPEYMHLYAEASRLAFADRSVHLGDPDFWDVPYGLLDDSYLAKRRKLISDNHASSSGQVGAGMPPGAESEETTHFSICDRDGNMVAITTTLNTSYGSKLVVEGAGFLLNNEMDDFSIKPGHPNTYGLVGAEANKIEPGKRMLSSMSPTLVLKDNQPFLILGSPGGSTIISTVTQAILDFVRFDISLEETVAHPRFHHQWLPDQIDLEEGRYDVATKQRLIGFGHSIRERTAMGDLQMIHIDRLGQMAAASDPRKRGVAGGY